jgi:polyisoprenoid-binding protein YceI
MWGFFSASSCSGSTSRKSNLRHRTYSITSILGDFGAGIGLPSNYFPHLERLRGARSRCNHFAMKLRLALVFVLLPIFCRAEVYNIDPVHSSIGFRVRHLFSKVPGTFSKVKGTINLNEQNPEKSSVEATIETASINTANDKRDNHLKSGEFFGVKTYPDMHFKSKSATKTGENTGEIVGDLTLHGVTKEVTLHVTFLGKGKGMDGNINTGWEATTAIKRSEFGLTWSKAVEGVAVVADDVEIILQISADRAKAA